MTHALPRPHLGSCPICEQGLIRFAQCPHCQQWIALCDECEAGWRDPHRVQAQKPNSQHPACPACHTDVSHWEFGTAEQLHRAGLSELIQGTSPS